MKPDINDIETAAKDLSIGQRAGLIRRLIASLDQEEDKDVEQLWLDEAERRLADYQSGKTSARSGEEVITEIREKLQTK